MDASTSTTLRAPVLSVQSSPLAVLFLSLAGERRRHGGHAGTVGLGGSCGGWGADERQRHGGHAGTAGLGGACGGLVVGGEQASGGAMVATRGLPCLCRALILCRCPPSSSPSPCLPPSSCRADRAQAEPSVPGQIRRPHAAAPRFLAHRAPSLAPPPSPACSQASPWPNRPESAQHRRPPLPPSQARAPPLNPTFPASSSPASYQNGSW